MPNLKSEIDFTQTIEAFEKLGKTCKQIVNAWENLESVKELRKLFKQINIGESNNYLKYHKRPMKRRRWLK